MESPLHGVLSCSQKDIVLVIGVNSNNGGFPHPEQPGLRILHCLCILKVGYNFHFHGGTYRGSYARTFYRADVQFRLLCYNHMMTLQGHIVDIVTTIVITAVVGGVVGWWLGRGK